MDRVEQRRGLVTKMDDKYLWVSIEQKSACNGCHAQSYCVSTDCKDRIIRLVRNSDENYKVGDEIAIMASESVGVKAVVIAFVIPVVLLIFSVLFTSFANLSSEMSALIVIGVLLVYYTFIYLLRSRINNIVRLYPHKITNDLQ